MSELETTCDKHGHIWDYQQKLPDVENMSAATTRDNGNTNVRTCRRCRRVDHKLWADGLPNLVPHPGVKLLKPVVLYFADANEREGFIAAVKEAKPGMAEYVVP